MIRSTRGAWPLLRDCAGWPGPQKTPLPLSFDNLGSLIGQSPGISSWVDVTQLRIDDFADCTEDRQWIHVDVERSRAESRSALSRPRLSDVAPADHHLRASRRAQGSKGGQLRNGQAALPRAVKAGARVRNHIKLVSAERRAAAGCSCAPRTRSRSKAKRSRPWSQSRSGCSQRPELAPPNTAACLPRPPY